MTDSNHLAFIIEPREDRIFAGATTVFDIRVENRSQHVVTFPNPGNARSPQPTYRLTRPDGQIEEFTPQRMAGEQAPIPSDAIPLVTLEPEEGWFGELALDRLTDLAQPGRYEFTGTIAWEGVTIEATPVAFSILNTNPEELSIALGIDDDGSLFCEAMLLQRSPDTLEAVAALLKEVDPRLGEMNVFNVVPRGGLPRNTYSVLGSYANYVDLVLRWTVALTGEGFFITENTEDKTCRVTCDRPIAIPLTPLSTSDQTLTLLAISAEPEPALWTTRLPEPASLPESTGMKQIAELKSAPLSGSVCLGSESQKSPVLVATTTVTGDGTILDVYRITDDGRVPGESKTFDGLRALPGLGAHIDAQGRTRFGFIAARSVEPVQPDTPEPLEEYVFVEVSGTLAENWLDQSRVYDPFAPVEIDGEVQIRYYERGPGDTRRAIAYQMADSGLFVLNDNGQPRASYTELSRFERWGLAPGRDTWYVVLTIEGEVTAGPL